MATEMCRKVVSLPDEMDRKIINLRKQDKYVRCSYSELIRILLESALQMDKYKTDTTESA